MAHFRKGKLCNLATYVIWWQSAAVASSVTAACDTSVKTANRLWTVLQLVVQVLWNVTVFHWVSGFRRY